MNVISLTTLNYGNSTLGHIRQTNPIQSQFPLDSKMNVTAFNTMNYEQLSMNHEKNKPNSNPIKSCPAYPERGRRACPERSRREHGRMGQLVATNTPGEAGSNRRKKHAIKCCFHVRGGVELIRSVIGSERLYDDLSLLGRNKPWQSKDPMRKFSNSLFPEK